MPYTPLSQEAASPHNSRTRSAEQEAGGPSVRAGRARQASGGLCSGPHPPALGSWPKAQSLAAVEGRAGLSVNDWVCGEPDGRRNREGVEAGP